MDKSIAVVNERDLRTLIGKDGDLRRAIRRSSTECFYGQYIWFNGTWRYHGLQKNKTTEYEEVWYYNCGFHMNGPEGFHNTATRINGDALYSLILVSIRKDGCVLLRYSDSDEIHVVRPE